jgi:ketosteroid isomerase-like protein
MKLKTIFIANISCTLFLVLTSCNTTKNAQTSPTKKVYIPADKPLYETIIKKDSILFEAFNTRDITALKSYFTDNLEVYQDNTGLRNYEETVQAFTELFKMDYVLTRKPILESIEVYPVRNFGAIETGQHTFCHTENGKLECATFKFVHIWENKNGQWKVAKIITYDHKM